MWRNNTGTGPLLRLLVSGVERLTISNAGQLILPATGSTGDLLIGGDTNLYRSAANTLRADDALIVGNGLNLN